MEHGIGGIGGGLRLFMWLWLWLCIKVCDFELLLILFEALLLLLLLCLLESNLKNLEIVDVDSDESDDLLLELVKLPIAESSLYKEL